MLAGNLQKTIKLMCKHFSGSREEYSMIIYMPFERNVFLKDLKVVGDKAWWT